jgi:hypothetical protein
MGLLRAGSVVVGLVLSGCGWSGYSGPNLNTVPPAKTSRYADVSRVGGNYRPKHRNKPMPSGFATSTDTLPLQVGTTGVVGTTPNVGTEEWKKQQEENARRDKELARVMGNICRGC